MRSAAGLLTDTSGQQTLNYIPFHVGEAEVSALEEISQAFVIDSQTAQQCRIEIVNVHGILDDVVAKVIGLAVADPRLDPSARDPQ